MSCIVAHIYEHAEIQEVNKTLAHEIMLWTKTRFEHGLQHTVSLISRTNIAGLARQQTYSGKARLHMKIKFNRETSKIPTP